MASATPTPVVFQQLRELNVFHGFASEDLEDWLDHFERFAAFNRWSDGRRIRRVFFALEDAARTWFENRERSLTSWDLFKGQFLQGFTSCARKERAELLLLIQRPNENVLVYVDEMVRLFRRFDPSMPDYKKLRHMMRAVKEQLFPGLGQSPPRAV